MDSELTRKMAAIMALGELFNKQFSEPATKLYIASLDGISAASIEKAARLAAATSKFMPSPSELRELAGEARPEDRAALAWEVVLRAISEIGGYKSPDFDDPYINGTIKILGGWVSLCDQKIDEQDRFTRANFCKTYAGLLRTGLSDELAAPLIGISEKHNATHRLGGPGSVVAVATGLPWAGAEPKRLDQRKSVRQSAPRLELKKA
jgi:hypothetical protein